MKIIPAIDIRGGRCVRLYQGDYDREQMYSEDPVSVALKWQHDGAELLHLVDLDGARDGLPTNRDIFAAIARQTSCLCEVGGGIRDEDHVRWYLDHGVSRIILGSMAISDPPRFRQICRAFPSRVVLALDARKGFVSTRGWREDSGFRAEDLLIQVSNLPLAAVQYTDIIKDGTLEGPNIPAVRSMAALCPFTFITAGGIGTLDHIKALEMLDRELDGKIGGVIVGQALYRGAFTLPEAILAACGENLPGFTERGS